MILDVTRDSSVKASDEGERRHRFVFRAGRSLRYSVQDGTTAVQEAAAWRRSYKTGYIKIRTKERRKLRLKIMLLIHLHDTKSR